MGKNITCDFGLCVEISKYEFENKWYCKKHYKKMIKRKQKFDDLYEKVTKNVN